MSRRTAWYRSVPLEDRTASTWPARSGSGVCSAAPWWRLIGQTVTVGLYDAVSNQVQPDYGLQFGFMFLAALIPVAGYLLVQKQFRAGLTAGSTR